VLLEFVLLWNNKRKSHVDDDDIRGASEIFWTWDRGASVSSSNPGEGAVFKPSVARFLALVEPSIGGLGRLTMALESVEHHLEEREGGRYRGEMPITFLGLWMERLGESALMSGDGREITLDELLNPESLVGSGLESWAEPRHMVSFIFSLRHFPRDDIDIMIDIARALSRNWQDRQKAGAFGAAAAFYVSRLSSDY
jgi:hypothetical protein